MTYFLVASRKDLFYSAAMLISRESLRRVAQAEEREREKVHHDKHK